MKMISRVMAILEEKVKILTALTILLSILPVAFLRVFMAPIPNVEPIMLFTIVIALNFGPISGFIFGAGSMFFSDFILGLPGPWTLYTSLAYGFVGLLVGFIGVFFKERKFNRIELSAIAFVMTILWDLITATFWAFQTMQPLYLVYVAQIPFTLLHLSNCIFAFLFAPYLMKFYSEVKNLSVDNFLLLFSRKPKFYVQKEEK